MQTLRWRYRGLYAVTEGIEHLHNPPERKETHNLETSIRCETPEGSVSGVNATDVIYIRESQKTNTWACETLQGYNHGDLFSGR